MGQPKRVAMWSGPRNISTALMRAWGNRPDTAVVDEPLYAHYLAATGLDHPGAAAVIAHHEPDWQKAVVALLGPVPGGKSVFYQKQMTHHLLPDMGRAWVDGLTNAFLVRDPRAMLASLAKVLPEPTLADTGLPQQSELFEHVRSRTGSIPPVIDARDVLEDPRRMLTLLCEAVGVKFDEAMLTWPPGRRETDGVWAEHWYASVEKSTGFEPYAPPREVLPARWEGLLADCQPYYDALYGHRLGR